MPDSKNILQAADNENQLEIPTDIQNFVLPYQQSILVDQSTEELKSIVKLLTTKNEELEVKIENLTAMVNEALKAQEILAHYCIALNQKITDITNQLNKSAEYANNVNMQNKILVDKYNMLNREYLDINNQSRRTPYSQLHLTRSTLKQPVEIAENTSSVQPVTNSNVDASISSNIKRKMPGEVWPSKSVFFQPSNEETDRAVTPGINNRGNKKKR